MSEKVIKLSPSSLNLFLECPRCFWLQINKGIKRPSPPSSTLPNGVDLSLKAYFDHWRIKNELPPLLKKQLPGKLVNDQALIAKFRSRSFGWFDKKTNSYLQGILDDALELNNNIIVPLDNKTKGFPPKEIHQAHQLQMSAYTLLLEKNDFKTKNIAYLVYWFFDHKNLDLDNPLNFNIAVEELKTNPEEILSVFRQAVELLENDIPPINRSCYFCQYQNLNYLNEKTN